MSLQSARGTHDLLFEDFKTQSLIIEKAQAVCECYGYEGISTPVFEFTDVFKRTLGETSDIVHKQMYTFPDNNGDLLTLRPEGTAGIARAFISNNLSRQLPLKLYYQGPMFRYERPQKGRQRQFHQFGVELLGVSDPKGDVEIISMGYSFLKNLEILSSISLDINTIGDQISRQAYKEKLLQYLEKFEKDLSEDSQRRLRLNPLRILDSKDEGDKKIVSTAPEFKNSLNSESRDFFDKVQNGLTLLGISFEINPRLVRGLDYYSHCVFEFKSNALGTQDAVLAGGRYDGLVELMGGPSTPGVGWAAGLERLALLVTPQKKSQRPVTMIPLGDAADRHLQKLAFELRLKGLAVELDFSGNIKKRLARATKANARWALILGDEELKKGVIVLKNLDLQTQAEISLEQETVLNSLLLR
jgi:histidyl-tRNA synthetase